MKRNVSLYALRFIVITTMARWRRDDPRLVPESNALRFPLCEETRGIVLRTDTGSASRPAPCILSWSCDTGTVTMRSVYSGTVDNDVR